MSDWFWTEQGEQRGPCSGRELRELASAGRVKPTTLVWTNGLSQWVPARAVKSLFPDGTRQLPEGSPEPPPMPTRMSGSGDSVEMAAALTTAKERASAFLEDLLSLNFREEIVPIDEKNFGKLVRNSVFWGVTLLGVVPLLIGTIDSLQYQLVGFALFFAVLWGVIFRSFIVRDSSSWLGLLASMFATGIAGIYVLLKLYVNVFPAAYLKLSESETGFVRLLGFVFQVGVCEELCKAAPVIVYLFWKRGQAVASTAILIGVFSGLGFAAFENMDYGDKSTVKSFLLAREYGAEGLVSGVRSAMINVMLRSVSLVFCHAVWSGIMAYFLAMGSITGRRRGALFLVGLLTASVLHGLYDWLCSVQATFAAGVAAASFMLFYAYLSKLGAETSLPTIVSPAEIEI
jgi:RsiW-degrading membrane proteinase PrsW (M82 family)